MKKIVLSPKQKSVASARTRLFKKLTKINTQIAVARWENSPRQISLEIQAYQLRERIYGK